MPNKEREMKSTFEQVEEFFNSAVWADISAIMNGRLLDNVDILIQRETTERDCCMARGHIAELDELQDLQTLMTDILKTELEVAGFDTTEGDYDE